jgi:hypothetical protein
MAARRLREAATREAEGEGDVEDADASRSMLPESLNNVLTEISKAFAPAVPGMFVVNLFSSDRLFIHSETAAAGPAGWKWKLNKIYEKHTVWVEEDSEEDLPVEDDEMEEDQED